MDQEQEPSTSQGRLSPPRRRPRVPYSVTEKLMIRNAFKYIYEEKAKECIEEHDYKMRIHDECVNKTAEMLGISQITVYKILREHKENKEFKTPRKTGPKRTFREKFSSSDFEGIRQKIHELKDNNETSIKKIHEAVLDDPTLPNFSKATMRRVMTHLKSIEENNHNASSSNNGYSNNENASSSIYSNSNNDNDCSSNNGHGNNINDCSSNNGNSNNDNDSSSNNDNVMDDFDSNSIADYFDLDLGLDFINETEMVLIKCEFDNE